MKKTRFSRDRNYIKEPERNSAPEKTVTKMKDTPGGSKVDFIKHKRKERISILKDGTV